MSSNSTDLESVVAALSVSLVDVQHALDTCWLLIASYLVFIMQLGFALLEAGCVRAINTKNIIMQVSPQLVLIPKLSPSRLLVFAHPPLLFPLRARPPTARYRTCPPQLPHEPYFGPSLPHPTTISRSPLSLLSPSLRCQSRHVHLHHHVVADRLRHQSG